MSEPLVVEVWGKPAGIILKEGNTFRLTLVTTTDPLARCAQVLTPFVQVVSLDVLDLPAGTYAHLVPIDTAPYAREPVDNQGGSA